MRYWLGVVMLLTLFAPATAAEIKLGDRLTPGGLMIGAAPTGSKVLVDGRKLRLADDGTFVFGVGRNAEGVVEVVVELPDGRHVERKIEIEHRDYDLQRIDGLPPRKVEPSKEDQVKIEADWIVLNEAKALDGDGTDFSGKAVWPVVGPISGIFGSQRILNGKPKSPHRGVDVAAPKGEPVNTMLDGVVIVAQPDMYYTGGTVMVDHGHGVKSLYAHLSEVSVKVGQRLARGDMLGRVGATGRVTGPHLHFSLYWFKTALDPALVLGPMPAQTQ